jgi:hypothetical protein
MKRMPLLKSLFLGFSLLIRECLIMFVKLVSPLLLGIFVEITSAGHFFRSQRAEMWRTYYLAALRALDTKHARPGFIVFDAEFGRTMSAEQF